MNKNRKPLSKARNLGRHGNRRLFTERDGRILRFLWKWKLASTATIHEALGRPLSDYSTYKTMERLARQKLVTTVEAVEQNFRAWTLTDRGFSSILPSLGGLSEEGFASENPWHDRNVLALQLGEWSTNQLPIITHLTEQEMRRRPLDLYPTWAPATKDHRPDGYSMIRTGHQQTVLAFEVEIWAKSVSTYESTLRFYRNIRNLGRVYWMIGDPYVKEQILRAKDCIKEDARNYHCFIDMNEYINVGWDAMVTNERSEKLGTYRQNMQGLCGDSYGKYVGTMQGQSSVTVHYDTRKVLGKKRT